jgi:hypothetical protein
MRDPEKARARKRRLGRSDHAREHATFPGARNSITGRFLAGRRRSGDSSEWPAREFPA